MRTPLSVLPARKDLHTKKACCDIRAFTATQKYKNQVKHTYIFINVSVNGMDSTNCVQVFCLLKKNLVFR